MRHAPLAIFTVLLAVIGTACAPLRGENSASSSPPDPAVELANAKAGKPDTYREGYIGQGDDRIHYVEAGSGPTVLFVHGFPAFWYVWFDQMEALRHCRRVIAIDAPGANLSAKPASTDYYRIENLADRLDAVIAELAPNEQIALVGHDWGGALVWSYAERDSSRIERLAVFSAPPHDLMIELLADDPEQRQRSGYMERFASISLDDVHERELHVSLFEIGYRSMIERGILGSEEGKVIRSAIADPQAIHAGMDWYRANIPPFQTINPDLHAWPYRHASTNVPTLLVRGENDRTFVESMGARASAHATDLRVTMIAGVSHWTPFEDPAAASRLLGAFLGVPSDCAMTGSGSE